MSIFKPKINSALVLTLFTLCICSGEVLTLYFSLKYFILLIDVFSEAILLLFLFTNSIFMLGVKMVTFISAGTLPSKRLSVLMLFLNIVFSVSFCVVNQFEHLDLISLSLGLFFQLITTLCQVDFINNRQISSVSIVYKV